jgi:hypothetical protein
MGLEACDQAHIDDLNRPIWHPHGEHLARGGETEELGLVHRERSAVGEMDIERLEWLYPTHLSKLFDGHEDRLPDGHSSFNGRLSPAR